MTNVGKYSFVKNNIDGFDMLLDGVKVGAYFNSCYYPSFYGGYIFDLKNCGNFYMSYPDELKQLLMYIHMGHNMAMNRNHGSLEDRISRVENVIGDLWASMEHIKNGTEP